MHCGDSTSSDRPEDYTFCDNDMLLGLLKGCSKDLEKLLKFRIF